MKELIGLLLSLLTCVSLLVGSVIVFKTKNNSKVVTFSVSIGLIVLILLIIFHLIPECIHILNHEFNVVQSYAYLFLMVLVGMSLLKILDSFIPHHHGHIEKEMFSHIALVTFIALFIHNFIEGMALFTTTMSSIKSGVLLSVGIALHNVPLGLTITSAFYKDNKNMKKTFLYILLLGLSTFFGALLVLIFSSISSHNMISASILAITIGMIIYIICFEFLHIFKHSNDSYIKTLGLIIGGVLMLITTIL